MVKFESCTIVVGGRGSISEGSCVAGASVVAGESFGGGDGALEGLLLGALEVGAPVRTVVEGVFRGDGDGTGDEEDSGAIEGSGLRGSPGVAVAIIGLSIGAMGSILLCRCNRRRRV
jgi:hypothetical protein